KFRCCLLWKIWYYTKYFSDMEIHLKFPLGFCLLAVSFVLSGCQESQRQDVPSEESRAESPESREGALTVLTYDEYFSEEVISSFEKESGLDVKFVTFTNLDEMEALLRSRPSEFDLVITDGGTLADLIELQFLQPLDLSRISGFSNLDTRFLDLAFDPGNQYSVPYMWGTTLI